jgi:xeroderma pigmentosum group C-complementing protein
VGTTVLVPDDALRGSEEEVAAAVKSDKPVQTVYDIDASDESGMEWEDVELEPSGAVSALESKQPTSFHTDADAGEEPLRITLGEQVDKGKQKATSALRRKPVTGMEKKRRLDIHKVHLLCLLSHVQLRNSWCNDTDIQVGKSKLSLLIVVQLVNETLSGKIECSEARPIKTYNFVSESKSGAAAVHSFHDLCRRAKAGC